MGFVVPKSTVFGTIVLLRVYVYTYTMKLLKVALYTRVSTRDKQDTKNQLRQLREFCAKQDWTIVHEYEDRVSGKRADRDEFQKMFAAASLAAESVQRPKEDRIELAAGAERVKGQSPLAASRIPSKVRLGDGSIRRLQRASRPTASGQVQAAESSKIGNRKGA